MTVTSWQLQGMTEAFVCGAQTLMTCRIAYQRGDDKFSSSGVSCERRLFWQPLRGEIKDMALNLGCKLETVEC